MKPDAAIVTNSAIMTARVRTSLTVFMALRSQPRL